MAASEALAASQRVLEAAQQRVLTSLSRLERLDRQESFLDEREREMVRRGLASLEELDAEEAQAAPLSGSGGGDVASADGVISRQAPVDQLQVSLDPPPGFASWEDALGLDDLGFVGGSPREVLGN